MGALYTKLFSQDARVLMLGLDAAGKTTTLYRLRLGEVVSSIPTIGFNVETVQHKKFALTVWDVGGQDRIRPLWKHYFANTDAMLFVVDANDPERLNEASTELYKAMTDEEIKQNPLRGLVVFANKMDLPQALSVERITERSSRGIASPFMCKARAPQAEKVSPMRSTS